MPFEVEPRDEGKRILCAGPLFGVFIRVYRRHRQKLVARMGVLNSALQCDLRKRQVGRGLHAARAKIPGMLSFPE